MKNRNLVLCCLLQLIFLSLSNAQNTDDDSGLFLDQEPLAIRLNFSIKNIKHNTNDSTYLLSTLVYQNKEALWDSVEIELRARGNFRREHCYHAPLKVKLEKSAAKGTIFDGNRKFKIVLTCLDQNTANDYVVKEYMAYKLHEVISPHYFKTRLLNIEFSEERERRIKEHELKGILVEDIDHVAQRIGGEEIKKDIHPLQHDALSSVRNSLFQYMIGNTDFSAYSQHNDKLIFIDKKLVYVPYDFDMSGLVNASYATVSGVDNLPTKITRVTQRIYKGYSRDEQLLQEVRQEYLSRKKDFFSIINSLEGYFENHEQFRKAKEFLTEFFEILASDLKFTNQIVQQARAK